MRGTAANHGPHLMNPLHWLDSVQSRQHVALIDVTTEMSERTVIGTFKGSDHRKLQKRLCACSCVTQYLASATSSSGALIAIAHSIGATGS